MARDSDYERAERWCPDCWKLGIEVPVHRNRGESARACTYHLWAAYARNMSYEEFRQMYVQIPGTTVSDPPPVVFLLADRKSAEGTE